MSPPRLARSNNPRANVRAVLGVDRVDCYTSRSFQTGFYETGGRHVAACLSEEQINALKAYMALNEFWKADGVGGHVYDMSPFIREIWHKTNGGIGANNKIVETIHILKFPLRDLGTNAALRNIRSHGYSKNYVLVASLFRDDSCEDAKDFLEALANDDGTLLEDVISAAG